MSWPRKSLSEKQSCREKRQFFLVPSHIRLDKIEQQLAPDYSRNLLKKAIDSLDFDYIVIDCRPTLGTLTINALYAANFIIVPCEMGAMPGRLADLMETIEHVKTATLTSRFYPDTPDQVR